MTTFSNNDFFWDWWETQEAKGRYYSGGWKYQRERWHLLALHSPDFLVALSQEIWLELYAKLGHVEVAIQSVWVDQTPQASSTYMKSSREHKVKCELADLIVITEIEFAGEDARPEDRRAVLVQAKVTSQPGVLEMASPGSSSYKERNLLELCCSAITLRAGVGASKLIGTFNLGCSSSALGLEKFAKYLSIPDQRAVPATAPYQAMWPHSREVQVGLSNSWVREISDMLLPGTFGAMGAPLAGAGSCMAWTSLVESVTARYALASVRRFPQATGGGFPRVSRSSVSYDGSTVAPAWLSTGIGFTSKAGFRLALTGNVVPPPPGNQQPNLDDESTPSIPYLFVQARVFQPREEALNDNYIGRRGQRR